MMDTFFPCPTCGNSDDKQFDFLPDAKGGVRFRCKECGDMGPVLHGYEVDDAIDAWRHDRLDEFRTVLDQAWKNGHEVRKLEDEDRKRKEGRL